MLTYVCYAEPQAESFQCTDDSLGATDLINPMLQCFRWTLNECQIVCLQKDPGLQSNTWLSRIMAPGQIDGAKAASYAA